MSLPTLSTLIGHLVHIYTGMCISTGGFNFNFLKQIWFLSLYKSKCWGFLVEIRNPDSVGSLCISVSWVNAKQATFTDVIFHTFGPRLSRFSSPSGTGNRYVCDKFDARRGTLFMSWSFELPTRIAVRYLVSSLWSGEAEGFPFRSLETLKRQIIERPSAAPLQVKGIWFSRFANVEHS